MNNIIKVPRWPLYTGRRLQVPNRFIVHAMGEFVKNPETGRVLYAPHWIEFLGLSVHAFITPDARVIESLAPDVRGAHAAPYNTGSIGFEFLVAGVHQSPSLRAAMKLPNCVTPAQLGIAAEWCWEKAAEYSVDVWSTHHVLLPFKKVDPWLPGHPSQAQFETLMNAGGISYATD